MTRRGRCWWVDDARLGGALAIGRWPFTRVGDGQEQQPAKAARRTLSAVVGAGGYSRRASRVVVDVWPLRTRFGVVGRGASATAAWLAPYSAPASRPVPSPALAGASSKLCLSLVVTRPSTFHPHHNFSIHDTVAPRHSPSRHPTAHRSPPHAPHHRNGQPLHHRRQQDGADAASPSRSRHCKRPRPGRRTLFLRTALPTVPPPPTPTPTYLIVSGRK